MKKYKILVTSPLLGEEIENIKTDYNVVDFTDKNIFTREVFLKEIKDADALLCVGDKVDREVIDKAKRLKVIAQAAVGVDNIDVEYCTQKGIPIGNTPDVLTSATANIGILHVLNGLRGFVRGGNDIRKGKWANDNTSFTLGRDVEDKNLVIVGFGKIGRNLAKKALAFNLNVFGCSPSFKESIFLNGKEIKPITFEKGIKIADVLSLSLPLTESTKGLINKDVFKNMRNDAILVNIARGPIVVTDDLYDALVSNEIGYASLDVLDPEPIPKDHPLLKLENVFITPHMGSSTIETRTKMANLAVSNIICGLQGKKLKASVNQHLL